MDGTKPTSITPQDLRESVGTAAAPIIVDVRCAARCDADGHAMLERGMVAYDALYAWCRAQSAKSSSWRKFRGSRSMIRQTMTAMALATTIFSPSAQVSAQNKTGEIDIAALEPGTVPRDFELWRTGKGDPAEWVVVQDASATNGKAIAQTSTDRTDYRFPLAIYKPISAKDVDVTIRFKPVSGKVDQAGGIAVRLTTPDDYYVVRANALEDNVRFYRVVNGKREQIKGANVKVASNQWHTLGLKAEGDQFTVSFDGKALYTAQDKTFAGSGKVALWTKADSVTHFDKITITPLP